MKNFFDSKSPIRFILRSFSLYIAWYLLYEIWLHPQQTLDTLVINNIGYWSELILKTFGYTLIKEFPVKDIIRTIGIDGTVGVWIGDSCDGISIAALFTGFVIAYPGKIFNKFLFIPLGIISIHTLNIIRVVLLCIIQYYDYTWLDFNHTYTFTSLMYLYVFGLWYMWITKFATK